jgi:mRNA interferase MazF
VAAPERGDLVWLDFSPQAGHEQAGHEQAGHEQAGRRPALVLSPRNYHQKTAFAVVCPITSRVKGYPFEVVLPEGLAIGGGVLADQVKSVDRHVRRIEVAGRVPDSVVEQVNGMIRALLAG